MIPQEYEETGIPVDAAQYVEHCVRVERERCAKIAEQWARNHGPHVILRSLARQIREGSDA